MNSTFFLKIKIKPEFTSIKHILEEIIDATLSLNTSEIKFEYSLRNKIIFATLEEFNASCQKIFFEIVSFSSESRNSIIQKIILKEDSIVNYSLSFDGDSAKIIFSSIEFDIADIYSKEDEMFCMYYGNLISYIDFYNEYNYSETLVPSFKLERKNDYFHKLSSSVSIRPELNVEIKDTTHETTYVKKSFINIDTSLPQDISMQYVNTFDLIFSFYYRKKVKCNFIKYIADKKGKIIYSVFNNIENERFPTFHLGMQNKFILLYNINFETVHHNADVFSDIINLYINACQSRDDKSKFILFYSVLELLKANFSKEERISFNFKDFKVNDFVKSFLHNISKYLVVEPEDDLQLKKEKEMITGEPKIQYISQAIMYKPLKGQFDALLENYPINLNKYGVDLKEIVRLRGRLFHGSSLKRTDIEYLKKICTLNLLPKFITELIAKIMGADPQNYNRNIYEP